MSEKSLRVLYSIGLGIVIVLFVGLGIATFYPAPEHLPYNSDMSAAARDVASTAYEAAMKEYNRNVTVAALASALLILGASIWSESRKPLFAGGFLLGGLLTLIYGLMRGLTSGVTAVAFFSVTVGLVVVVYLGHQRFFSARAVTARAKARENDRAAYAPMPMQPQYAPAPQAQQPPAGFPYAAGQPYQQPQSQPGHAYPQHGQYPPQVQPMQQPYPPQQGQYPPAPGAE